ncbi:MAG: DJ-1/PfpI family protein [Candidatus Omnitrophica bacterium]|nr:DJ-1/PfpI family protein [Candidatus Omnitrophota bacterium]
MAICMAKGAIMVLMVIAQNGFRDEEYFKPKDLLEFAGCIVKTASVQTGAARGKMGGTAKVDVSLSEVKVEDYAAVVFVGGPGAADYIDDETALNLAREADKKGRIVGAICIAPAILARAGILKGKKATVFPSDRGILIEGKANYVDMPVVVDGRIITASGPDAAHEFGKTLVKALGADNNK